MPIQRMGKARESLTFSGEEYKRLVREYLESQGFGQISDSYVEGHLMDMVMVNPNTSLEKEFWIECKGTAIGPNNEKFVTELISYLLEWWQQKDRKDIEVRVYVTKILNFREFEKILSKKYGKKLIPLWVSEAKKSLEQEKLDLLSKIKDKSIVEFFQNMDIFEMDAEFLRRATKENLKRNNYSLQRYAEHLLLQNKRRSQPVKERTTLILNLLEINYPDVLYRATSTLPNKDEIYAKFNSQKIEIPPMTFYPQKQQISSFCSFDESNPLTEIVDKSTIISVSLKESDVSQQNIHGVLNQHLKRLLWKKGLTRIPDTNTYYFQIEPEKGILNDKEVEGEKGDKKVMIRVYRKPDEVDKAKVNFVFHHAIEIKPFFLWGKTYLEIIPRKIFTLDGKMPLVGKEKSRLDAYFRNPMFNRNQSKLIEIKFWKEFLRRADNYVMRKEQWFDVFKIGDVKKVPFDWKPKISKDMEQAKIGEFTND